MSQDSFRKTSAHSCYWSLNHNAPLWEGWKQSALVVTFPNIWALGFKAFLVILRVCHFLYDYLLSLQLGKKVSYCLTSWSLILISSCFGWLNKVSQTAHLKAVVIFKIVLLLYRQAVSAPNNYIHSPSL